MEVAQFHQIVQSSDKPMFALVSASWCNPCKLIKPEFNALKTSLKDKAAFEIIDADESQDFCMHYSISSIPTVLVFKNSSPDVVDTFTGSNADSFKKFVNKHL